MGKSNTIFKKAKTKISIYPYVGTHNFIHIDSPYLAVFYGDISIFIISRFMYQVKYSINWHIIIIQHQCWNRLSKHHYKTRTVLILIYHYRFPISHHFLILYMCLLIHCESRHQDSLNRFLALPTTHPN